MQFLSEAVVSSLSFPLMNAIICKNVSQFSSIDKILFIAVFKDSQFGSLEVNCPLAGGHPTPADHFSLQVSIGKMYLHEI
jgi:hypothetical protein